MCVLSAWRGPESNERDRNLLLPLNTHNFGSSFYYEISKFKRGF